jgi:hypothetical protein
MSKSIRMALKLDEEDEGTQGLSLLTGPRRSPQRVDVEDHERALDIWNRGLKKVDDHQKSAAAKLGISEAHLSDLCNDRRTLAFHRVRMLCRKHQDAALSILTDLAKDAGLVPPRKKRTVSQPVAQRQMILELRELAPVYELIVTAAAAKLGTDETVLHDILEDARDESVA